MKKNRQGRVTASHVNRLQYFHYMEMKESRMGMGKKIRHSAAFENFLLSLVVGGTFT